MKLFLSMLALLLASGTASAQSTDASRIFKAGSGGAVIMATVAEMMIATETCALGNRADWQKVVDAVDRRYRFCVAKDPAWGRLMDDFRQATGQTGAAGPSRAWGSFAVESMLETRGAESRAMGNDAFCAKMPWKLVLEPSAATEEAKAEFKKANPDANLDGALRFFTYIRNLGADSAWTEAPCDTDFWPEFK